MDTGTVVNKQISCEEMLSKTKECVQMDIGRRKKKILLLWFPNREPPSRFPWAMGGERRKHVVAWQAGDRYPFDRFRVRPEGMGPTFGTATASSQHLFR
jgi:hypothetical protein